MPIRPPRWQHTRPPSSLRRDGRFGTVRIAVDPHLSGLLLPPKSPRQDLRNDRNTEGSTLVRVPPRDRFGRSSYVPRRQFYRLTPFARKRWNSLTKNVRPITGPGWLVAGYLTLSNQTRSTSARREADLRERGTRCPGVSWRRLSSRACCSRALHGRRVRAHRFETIESWVRWFGSTYRKAMIRTIRRRSGRRNTRTPTLHPA